MKKKLVFQKKILSNLQNSELQQVLGGESGGMLCDKKDYPPFDASKANLCHTKNLCI